MDGHELKEAARSLTPSAFAAFTDWFAQEQQRRAIIWDDQLERDVTSGKLDPLYDELARRYQAGETAKLPIKDKE